MQDGLRHNPGDSVNSVNRVLWAVSSNNLRYTTSDGADRKGNVMALILLFLGVVLIVRQRVDYGSLKAEGRHVRAAGALLTLPALLSVLLNGIFVPLAFGRNESAASFAQGAVGLFELAGMLLVAGLAWVLLTSPPGLPRLPGLLGDLQDEAREQRTTARPAASAPRPRVLDLPGLSQRLGPKRETFPSVMSLSEAALYMEVTEDDILQWIEEGRLTASRENYHYRIARSQLDELQ